MASDKVDLTQLQTAIDAAEAAQVRQRIIEKGKKQLELLKYAKAKEGELSAAIAEKNKETLMAIIEQIEKEGIAVEPKMLNDAKNTLAKIK